MSTEQEGIGQAELFLDIQGHCHYSIQKNSGGFFAMFVEPRMPAPCLGCGYCCLKKTCTFGRLNHPEAESGRCPELQWNGKRYVCGIMSDPRSGDYFRMELRAGQGCVTASNPWRQEIRERSDEEMLHIRQGPAATK